LFGIGERTGNTPLEAMIMEYAQFKGDLDGIDTTIITDIADYFKKELNYTMPPRTPFVGNNFNVTRAGIHADGLLKNEEIYNIFDTNLLLKRPVKVAITNTSGISGIAHWINSYLGLEGEKALSKHNEIVRYVKSWVDMEYRDGRVTAITDTEMIEQIHNIRDNSVSNS
jgi:isopropylmalate/homocitrate/citramalate synthase